KYVDMMKTEENYEVMLSVLKNLQSLVSIFYDDDQKREFFTELIVGIIGDRANSIVFDQTNKGINESMVNTLIISKAVHNKHQPTLDRFRTMKLGDDIISDYIRPFYSAIVDERFEDIFEIYMGAATVGLRQHALIAMGATSDRKNLEFIFKNHVKIEPHESVYLYASLGANLSFRHEIAEFFMQNYEEIKAHINNSNLLRYSLEYSLKNVLNEAFIGKVHSFLNSIDGDASMRSAIDKCRDSLYVKTKFRENYKNTVFTKN
ncbi:hypothetical protein PAEPH01_2844, partial [Pancytospora epiphaga]